MTIENSWVFSNLSQVSKRQYPPVNPCADYPSPVRNSKKQNW